jgi:hypothetical protein
MLIALFTHPAKLPWLLQSAATAASFSRHAGSRPPQFYPCDSGKRLDVPPGWTREFFMPTPITLSSTGMLGVLK